LKGKNIFFIASVSILIPATGRLGYGIILLIGLISINCISSLLYIVFKKCDVGSFETPLQIFTTIAVTIIFKECVRYYSPILSFNLHFSFYLVCFSSFLFTSQIKIEQEAYAIYLFSVLKQSLAFSFFGLFFFSLREYVAYASLSLPITQGLKIILIPAVHLFNGSFLWSSTGFALVLMAIILIVVSAFQKKKAKG
jgi:hypothetical protein